MKLDREAILDNLDNLRDVMRYGPWWQRLILLGVPLCLAFLIFWFRPLPGQISEKLDYWDQCERKLFADGATSMMDDFYEYTTPDGKMEIYKKDRWRKKLRGRYLRFSERGWTIEPKREPVTFYWTGIHSLVQTVSVSSQTRQRGVIIRDKEYLADYSWKKRHDGWYIDAVHVREQVR